LHNVAGFVGKATGATGVMRPTLERYAAASDS
jgi:hypothetical protein